MTRSPLSVVIHGHFYQPPRDDPWLETVEAQLSAQPFHDWNERVTEECYKAVVAARVPGSGGRIASIVNTLASISFNFGPTLLEWMETAAPDTYQAILSADALSAERLGGHGNALAQAYHHSILPLASHREKVSEIRWGIADFRKRFQRDPAGLWLPETAVDAPTLEVLAQEGIAFTILAPNQVASPPPRGLPGLFKAKGGRQVALFVYDGPLSHGVGFGAFLREAEGWTEAILKHLRDPDPPALISMATDGETYGHHHRFGEMALAAVLGALEADPRNRVENFASFLSRNPPVHEVSLVEPSSWSCVHGVDRWRSDCGCKMDPEGDTQQEWRTDLRTAVEWLASQIHQLFQEEGPRYFDDPWEARNRYGPHPDPGLTEPRGLELLELERLSLRLFTSCGWFFDDLAGIEPRQILRYAARAMDLLGPRREDVEDGFLRRLAEARSNEDPPRDGRTIYLEEARPRRDPVLAVAAGAALWDTVTDPAGVFGSWSGGAVRAQPRVPAYDVSREGEGRYEVVHRRTRRPWTAMTHVHRPADGDGVVSAWFVGREEAAEAFSLSSLPEGFGNPIREHLARRVPDPATAMVQAVHRLARTSAGLSVPSPRDLDHVRDLADLLALLESPIPFDAQTVFFRALQEADAGARGFLEGLRELLGFTPPEREE